MNSQARSAALFSSVDSRITHGNFFRFHLSFSRPEK